jgi:type II secretory pathway predicted ATPase ExeA
MLMMNSAKKAGIAELGYLKWLLKKNPFSSISSEALSEITPLHVDTEVDKDLARIVRSTIERGTKGLLFVVGEFGSGKTHRLRLISELVERIPCYYIKVDVESLGGLVRRIYEKIEEEGLLSKIEAILKLREERIIHDNYEDLAEDIANILSQKGYFILMLDEIENLVQRSSRKELERLGSFLHRFYDRIERGIIVIACVPKAFNILNLYIRDIPYNRVVVKRISNEEAELILSKRLQLCREGAARRISLDSLYPFKRETVHKMNEIAGGNPRRLLKYARMLLASSVASVLEGNAIGPEFLLKEFSPTKGSSHVKNDYNGVFKTIRNKFGERSFSIIEASKVINLPIAETKELLEKLVEENKLMRDGFRYKVC